MSRKALWLTVFVALGTAAALGADPQWLSPDGSPPGTPSTIVYDRDASGPNESVFHVQTHGLFVEAVEEPGQTFRRLHVPGMRSLLGGIGRPALPSVPLLLRLPTDAESIRIQDVEVLQSASYSGYHVYPAQSPLVTLAASPPLRS